MRIKTIFVLLVSLGVLSACQSAPIKPVPAQKAEPTVPAPEETVTPDLKAGYQQGVKDALAVFFQNDQAAQAKEKMLLLKTPQEYLQLHLNLVIALDMIEQGTLDGDQAKIDSGRQKISQLAQEYPFIK